MAYSGLTEKEKAFCEEFIANGYNATQAYFTVYGGTMGTARATGCKVIKRPQCKAYIEKLQKDAYESAFINAERVAVKLAEIAFAQKDDEDYGASAQLKALDLLQKQLGLQTQKVEADISTDINISIEE